MHRQLLSWVDRSCWNQTPSRCMLCYAASGKQKTAAPGSGRAQHARQNYHGEVKHDDMNYQHNTRGNTGLQDNKVIRQYGDTTTSMQISKCREKTQRRSCDTVMSKVQQPSGPSPAFAPNERVKACLRIWPCHATGNEQSKQARARGDAANLRRLTWPTYAGRQVILDIYMQ